MYNIAELIKLEQITTLCIIAVLGFTFNYVLQSSLKALSHAKQIPPTLLLLMGKLTKYLIYVIMITTILGTLGLQLGPILTSLGLGGLALSFGLRDAVSNLISGIIIIIYRPFTIGDQIEFKPANKEFEGRVTDINLRHVTLESDQGKTLIPNSVITATPILIRRR